MVGFAGRDDANAAMSRGVDHHEQPPLNLASQLKTFFAIAAAGIGHNDAVWVKKYPGCKSEVKPPARKAGLTFNIILFEIHASSVVQWPSFGKLSASACPISVTTHSGRLTQKTAVCHPQPPLA